MNALRRVVAAVVRGGIILDLQTVRPPPVVEAEGRAICEIEASAFFARADANDAVLLGTIEEGVLTLEAEEHLDVLARYATGAELLADWDSRSRKVPPSMRSVVRAIPTECVVREPCRTRRLRVR